MRADDASSAEMRRPPDPDADPLALDDDTVERLLSGTLPPGQAPPGFAKVAELLAAAAAAPSSAELAGQAAVLTELRAVTRGRPPAVGPSRRARTSRRRSRTGLAVVVAVGALVTGGVAGAATGHLPGPVRAAARTVLGSDGGTPSTSTQAGQPPGPVKPPAGSGGGLGGARPGVSTGPGGAVCYYPYHPDFVRSFEADNLFIAPRATALTIQMRVTWAGPLAEARFTRKWPDFTPGASDGSSRSAVYMASTAILWRWTWPRFRSGS